MKGGRRLYYLAGTAVLLALAGCGRGFVSYGERETWRHEAELQCLKSGAVKVGSTKVQIQPIEGPGMCGADFPLKVAALGEGSVLGFLDDDPRPPGRIPNGGQEMPRFPQTYQQSQQYQQPQYQPAQPQYQQPAQPQYMQSSQPQYQQAPQYQQPQYSQPQQPQYARPGEPMSLDAPAANNGARPQYAPQQQYQPQQAYPQQQYQQPSQQYAPQYSRQNMPDDIPDDAVLPDRSGRVAPRTQPAYSTPVYQQPQRQTPSLGPARGPRFTGAVAATVTPAATLACPLVSALDRWVMDGVQPAAMRWFGQPVVEIKQISAYSCRSMQGDSSTSRISEHAFGNALDVAGFRLADGRKVMVRDGWHGAPEEQGFLRDVHMAACDIFSTVLAPGYNAAHYDHIHVDLMRRESGRHPCRPDAISGEMAAAKARSMYAQKRGPLYTGSVMTTQAAAPKTQIAIPGEDGFVLEEEPDTSVTGSIGSKPARNEAIPGADGEFDDEPVAAAPVISRSKPGMPMRTPDY